MVGLGPRVVRLTGCVPELVPRSTAYLRVRAVGSPVVLASMVAQAGLLAQRDSATPLRAVSMACVLNIVWKSKFYGAFVLNRRVVLHAIDALIDFHIGLGYVQKS